MKHEANSEQSLQKGGFNFPTDWNAFHFTFNTVTVSIPTLTGGIILLHSLQDENLFGIKLNCKVFRHFEFYSSITQNSQPVKQVHVICRVFGNVHTLGPFPPPLPSPPFLTNANLTSFFEYCPTHRPAVHHEYRSFALDCFRWTQTFNSPLYFFVSSTCYFLWFILGKTQVICSAISTLDF